LFFRRVIRGLRIIEWLAPLLVLAGLLALAYALA
jgi:hypothetical protein